MEKTYLVNNMTCVICKSNVEKTLNNLDGVNSAIVSLMDNEVLIDFNENTINEAQMANALRKEGYELVINSTKKISFTFIKLIISIILTILLMIISMFIENTMYIQLVLALTIICLNINYYFSGFKSLLKLRPNMDSLVSISSLVSLVYSVFSLYKISKGNNNYHLYFETSAMVLVIVSIGKYIENKNKKKTTKFIRGLSTLIPMQANKLVDKEILITPIEEIKKGDYILIKPGESIPQDGIVIEGHSSVDESMITGESNPNYKQKDSLVIGGTVNIDGQLIVEVNKVSTQTTLSKIVSLTKKATLTKLPIERFTDKISSYFVYIVLSISLVTFVIWIITSKDLELSLNFALSVLVISCPCALGLATPSAVAVSCNTANKNGILIKNPEILEIAYKIKNIIFDKTGTLTKNKLEIVDIEKYDSEFENVLASLEQNSNHPIASAIIEKYSVHTLLFNKLEQISGEGIVGYIDNDVYFAGNKSLLEKHNIIVEDNKALTIVGVGKNDRLLGIVYLKDEIKDDTVKMIDNLNRKNINVIMATGDNKNVAEAIAKELNITKYYAEVKPQDKQNIVVENKNNGITAMVGDGINDAIALTSADVSITLTDSTDIANASSDVSLLSNNISDINFLIDLSKKTMTIIKQNLFWALGYNSLFIPLAGGLFYKSYGLMLNPMIGSITMSISSIIVILNALRISKMKKEM